jgi:hypothetical protein
VALSMSFTAGVNAPRITASEQRSCRTEELSRVAMSSEDIIPAMLSVADRSKTAAADLKQRVL